jgi:hypothetical protein
LIDTLSTGYSHFERKPRALPPVQATLQRVDACESELTKPHGDLCGSRFSRVIAEENNVAVGRDLVSIGHHLLGRKMHGTWKGAPVGCCACRVPQVDHAKRLAE